MRRLIPFLTLAALAGAGLWSNAQDAAAPTAEAPPTTPPPPSTQYETTTHGDPGLRPGRWVVLTDLDLSGRRRTIANFWEITEGPDGLELTEYFANPPPSVKASLDAVTGTGVIWTPTEAELAAIDEHWAELEDMRRGVTAVSSELWGREAYDEDIKQEEKTKDAIWVVRQTYQFEAGGSRPVRQVNIYGALAPEGRGYTGNFSAVAVAAAPFPVPIPYSGSFRMLAIGPEPAKGFLARLADVFSGCGR